MFYRDLNLYKEFYSDRINSEKELPQEQSDDEQLDDVQAGHPCLGYYWLGKRDAIAETLMIARLKTPEDVIIMLAEQMIESDKENLNPHAVALLEKYKKK